MGRKGDRTEDWEAARRRQWVATRLRREEEATHIFLEDAAEIPGNRRLDQAGRPHAHPDKNRVLQGKPGALGARGQRKWGTRTRGIVCGICARVCVLIRVIIRVRESAGVGVFVSVCAFWGVTCSISATWLTSSDAYRFV